MANIYLRFFPNDVTDEQVRSLIEPIVPVQKVTIMPSHLPDKAAVIVRVELSQAAANIIARKINVHLFEGHAIKAVALLH